MGRIYTGERDRDVLLRQLSQGGYRACGRRGGVLDLRSLVVHVLELLASFFVPKSSASSFVFDSLAWHFLPMVLVFFYSAETKHKPKNKHQIRFFFQERYPMIRVRKHSEGIGVSRSTWLATVMCWRLSQVLVHICSVQNRQKPDGCVKSSHTSHASRHFCRFVSCPPCTRVLV